jgi:GAF domain-containing protein
LEQTQKRATYLEMLAQVELELSQATTEEEILTVVTTIAERPEKLGRASLSYITLDENNRPDAVSLQATWADGELRSDSPLLNQAMPLADYPSSELWLSRPNEVTFISDVQQSELVDEFSRRRAEAAGLHAMALIPLRSGNRWQGVINLFWSEPDGFGEVEQFVLPQLMDSMAAVVASRRAQLAQQAARHEAETLYEASQRINESPTTSAILAAMVERTEVTSLNRAAVLRFATQENGDDRHLAVTATWYSGEGQLPPSVGTRYPLSAFAAVGPVWEPEPIFIGDTTELEGQAAEFAQQFEMQSMILLPLFSGSKQVGLILMAGEQPVVFEAATRRILSSLAPQVAIALENKRLLADTEARARREQLLRQITARVRGSADIDTIMRTAVQEIGRSLGRKAFIYVSNDDELETTE